MRPLVSVIIPTYNRENLIVRSVNSVRNQTYDNLEIIIVDDCSNDNTENVIRGIDDDRIRFVKLEKNSGACAARNYGIDIANGDYIAFQDSDDVWRENKIEIQLQRMISESQVVSFCNFCKHTIGKNKTISLPSDLSEGIIDRKEILKRSVVSTQCLMVRADCVKETRFDITMPRLQDWDLAIELSKKYPIYHLDEVLVDMYVQNDSISAHPEKGVIALNKLLEKNGRDVDDDKETASLWHIYMGDYLVECHKSPSEEYKKSLDLQFNGKIAFYYVLSKCRLLIPIKRLLGKV